MAAIIELYGNGAYSALSAPISNTATTLTVTTGTGTRFPTPVAGVSFFRLTITSAASPNTIFEIVYVTQKVGDTFTVTRGAEGSTAQAWSLGDLCGLEPTAGMLEQFLQPYFGVDTGTTNAYAVEIQNSTPAYYSGMPVAFSTLNANTSGTVTLNVNGIGTAPVTNNDGSALLSGQIIANALVDCFYNAAKGRWELQSMNGVGITPTFGDSTTKYATTAFVQNALGAYIPSGTKVLFYQAAAPTGWTQLTTVSDSAIRIVSGAGGGSTGGNAFSSTFVSQAVTGSVSIATATGTVGGTALTTEQLPSHNHGVNDPTHSHGVNDPGHNHTFSGGGNLLCAFNGQPQGPNMGNRNSSGFANLNAAATGIYLSGAYTGISIGYTGSNQQHNHPLTMNPQSASFAGNPIPMNVKYIDVIICSKN